MNIFNNSYHILWLSIEADDKLILKRYKELLNLLQIDEVWSYPLDFSQIDYSLLRTEESIKKAYFELTNVTTKIKNNFFWFDLIDENDDICFKLLIENNFVSWIEKWEKLYNTTYKIHYLKNSIIANLMLFEEYEQLSWDMSFELDYDEFIENLKVIFEDKKYWKQFENIYNLHSDIKIREDILNDFINWLPQFFAEYLFDLCEERDSVDLYKIFVNIFNLHAKDLDDNKVVIDFIDTIEKINKKIDKLDISKDIDVIIDYVNMVTDELKKLDSLWLEHHIKITKIKDDFARKIRGLSIDLFNNHDDADNAINFLEEAINVASSINLQEKFKKDIKDMEIESKNTDLLKKIIDINKEWQDNFKNKNYKSSYNSFSSCINIILDEYSEKFNLDKSKINLLIFKIENSFNMIGVWGQSIESVIANIDKMKNMVKEDWWFSWGEDLEFLWLSGYAQLILIIWIDSIAFRKISNMLMNKASSENESNVIKRVVWIIIIIVFAVLRNS